MEYFNTLWTLYKHDKPLLLEDLERDALSLNNVPQDAAWVFDAFACIQQIKLAYSGTLVHFKGEKPYKCYICG